MLAQTLLLSLVTAEPPGPAGINLSVEAWSAILTVVTSTAVILIRKYVSNPAKQSSTPAELRQEQRARIESLRDENADGKEQLAKKEEELNAWRDKYWLAREELAVANQKNREFLYEIEKLKLSIEETDK